MFLSQYSSARALKFPDVSLYIGTLSFLDKSSLVLAEVTGKAIEETAAVILRLYQDRKNKCSMPRISKRY